jgi:FkbM family methyltransferase
MVNDGAAGEQISDIVFESGHLRVRRCRHGLMLYNLNDLYVGKILDLYGEFSEGEVDLFRQVLRPGMTVVEAGANIGAHTLPIAQFVGPSARVIVFEPQRTVFQMLCANLALNRLEQVEAHWAAVADYQGEILVPRLDSTAKNNFGGLSIEGAPFGDKVRVVTLDALQLPACHFLKIDVEGMELDVLRGAADTIRRHNPVVYAENDRKEKSAALIEFLFGLDYRCYWHKPPYVRVPNFRNNHENEFVRVLSFNILCIPRRTPSAVTGLQEILSPRDSWKLAE